MTIQSDSGSRLPPPRQGDIRTLPEISSLTIVRRRYRRPRRFQLAGRLIEISEGTEIVVETDGEIPIRALSPVLNVGSTQLTELERASERSYRFFVLDEPALREGAPIRLGWIGLPPPKDEALFTYYAPRGEAEEAPVSPGSDILTWIIARLPALARRIIERLFGRAGRR